MDNFGHLMLHFCVMEIPQHHLMQAMKSPCGPCVSTKHPTHGILPYAKICLVPFTLSITRNWSRNARLQRHAGFHLPENFSKRNCFVMDHLQNAATQTAPRDAESSLVRNRHGLISVSGLRPQVPQLKLVGGEINEKKAAARYNYTSSGEAETSRAPHRRRLINGSVCGRSTPYPPVESLTKGGNGPCWAY